MKKLKNPKPCGLCGAPITSQRDRVYVAGVIQHAPGRCVYRSGPLTLEAMSQTYSSMARRLEEIR